MKKIILFSIVTVLFFSCSTTKECCKKDKCEHKTEQPQF